MDQTFDEPRSWRSAPVDADDLLRLLRAVKAALDSAPAPAAPVSRVRDNGTFQDVISAEL